MARRVVLTTRAEGSIAQMREAQAFFYWLEGEHQSESRLGPAVSQLSPAQLILPRVVSIAEDYARNLLLEASEALVDTSHPMHLHIWIHAEERAESTWESIRTAWKEWHGVVVTQAPTHLAFSGFVEARNAIMHGLGELTRKQSRTDGALARTISRLHHARLEVEGRRLVLGAESVDAAVDNSAGLVEWLDGQAVSKGIIVMV